MKYYYTVQVLNKSGEIVAEETAQDRFVLYVLKQEHRKENFIVKRHTISNEEWKERFC